jgi:splicing factor U2AF subunit
MRPEYSQTLLLPGMYHPAPLGEEPGSLSRDEEQERFDDFCEEVTTELAAHGRLEAFNVCENEAPHLRGNAYARFADEEDARAALEAVRNRWFGGRRVYAEYSPVVDFVSARCRQHDRRRCDRKAGECNFLHLRRLPGSVSRTLVENGGFERR